MTGVRTALALLAAATMAAPLQAQGTCAIEVRKPSQVSSAALYILKHDAQANEGDRSKLLQQAVKLLTDKPERIKNEVGRNYLLGAAYVRWLQDQGARPALRAKRGDVGFSEEPDGEFFLPAAMDEAMAAVEREMPACADSTMRYRSAAFSKVLNTSIAFYNAKQYEPAIEYANAALQINPRSPLVGSAYQVLANSAQAKGDLPGAIASWEKVIARMGTDSAAVAGRATASFNLAVLTSQHANGLAGSARSAGLRRAAELFKSAADLAPDGPNAARARAAYARTLQDAGDSAAVAGIYADMLAAPTKYTALQLFEAGVVLANSKQFEEAARLYEAGLAMNPHYRDALFNAANVYFALHQPDRMAPAVERLRVIDPMNPDVLRLAGAVWQERGRQATDAKARQMAQDSTIAYLGRVGKVPARVLVHQFSVGRDGSTTLAGSVENLGAAVQSFTLVFEFVDMAGAVVGTATVSAEGVEPRKSREFSAQANGAAPVAWRYTVR